jgi:hydrogenase maturation factor
MPDVCLSYPARVIAVDRLDAVVELSDGVRRHASTLLVPDVVEGELVAVAAGTIVGRLEASEADELAAMHRVLTGGPDGHQV